MSHGIKKETYIKADDQTTKALTFDLLDNLYGKMSESVEFHVDHMGKCETRFKGIENNKKKDTAIAAGSGMVGGSLTVLGLWFKKYFGGV